MRHNAGPGGPARQGSGLRFRMFGFTVAVPLNALVGVLVIAVLWYPEFVGPSTPLGDPSTPLGEPLTATVRPWLLAALFAVLLMISILLHELAHAIAARAFSYEVTGITLWAMGGFTTYRTGARHGPAREAVIALAGPATTLAVAGLAAAAESLVPQFSAARVLLSAVAAANLLIGIFNLLPGAPLDGGSLVKAGVWAATGSQAKGQVVAGWVGRGLAVLVFALPFLLAFAYGVPPSLTMILVGVVLGALLWFGASASLQAAAASQQLQAVPALRVSLPVVPMPETTSVAEALSRAGQGGYVVAVDPQGRPTGVLVPEAANAVPFEQRDRMPMTAACARLGVQVPTVAADATAEDVLQANQASGSRYVFVASQDGSARLVDVEVTFVAEGP